MFWIIVITLLGKSKEKKDLIDIYSFRIQNVYRFR